MMSLTSVPTNDITFYVRLECHVITYTQVDYYHADYRGGLQRDEFRYQLLARRQR